MSALTTSTCPECGSNITMHPQVTKVRHSGAIMIMGMTMMAIIALALMQITGAAIGGKPSPRAWMDLAILLLIAGLPGGGCLRLLFLPSENANDARVARVAAVIAVVSASAAVCWLKFVP